MAFLHLTGTPLTTTQAELTPLQRVFLSHALPDAWSMMHGQQRQGSGRGSGQRRGVDPDLRAEARRRQGGSG